MMATTNRKRRRAAVSPQQRPLWCLVVFSSLVCINSFGHEGVVQYLGRSIRVQVTAPSIPQRLDKKFRLHATSSRNLKADQQRNNRLSQTTTNNDRKKRHGENGDSENRTPRTTKGRSSKTPKRSNAVERLRKAAARAAAQQEQEQSTASATNTNDVASISSPLTQQQSTSSISTSTTSPLSSLTELNKAIDEQLLFNQQASSSIFVNGIVRQTRDSMTSLLGHNNDQQLLLPPQNTHCVAMVFAKALVRDQISVEYAARVQSLVAYLKKQQTQQQGQQHGSSTDATAAVKIVCFCGGTKTPTTGVYASDAGYLYFRHLCAAQQVSLQDVEFIMDRSSSSSSDTTIATGSASKSTSAQLLQSTERESLKRVMQHLRQHYIPQWLATSIDMEQANTATLVRRRRKKIGVQFVLTSSEYHLCSMNDIHMRSPNQSWLRSLQQTQQEQQQPQWQQQNYMGDDDDFWDDGDDAQWSDTNRNQQPSLNGIVETSWSYEYTTYPYIYAKEDTTAFMGRCYVLGQELMPLLVNLRGVVAEKEFCQRDNYLVLASIRRSLVTYMEKLYETQPFLRDELRDIATEDMNIVLEGAVLSLGRCMDLLRPAGLLVGSVNKSDYTKALRLLEHAMGQIQRYCDPDRALEPGEWGKLRSETEETKEQAIHPEVAAEQAMAMEELATAMKEMAEEDIEEQVEVPAKPARKGGSETPAKSDMKPKTRRDKTTKAN